MHVKTCISILKYMARVGWAMHTAVYTAVCPCMARARRGGGGRPRAA
eukprot:SAG31_NODE_30175_length_384_cov_1.438596_2_plen_46_part_01